MIKLLRQMAEPSPPSRIKTRMVDRGAVVVETSLGIIRRDGYGYIISSAKNPRYRRTTVELAFEFLKELDVGVSMDGDILHSINDIEVNMLREGRG